MHEKQFVISQNSAPEGWQSFSLAENWNLACHPSAKVHANNGTITVGVDLGNGAGRYVKIDWPFIKNDACGLMGVFYDPQPKMISSSMALLYDADADGSISSLPRKNINWFPSGVVPRIERLFRDQKLHIPTLAPKYLSEAIEPLGSYREAVNGLAGALSETISALPKGERIWLALTAGQDSRTIASALVNSGYNFETFTQLYRGISPSDVAIPKRIARYLGIKHHVVSPGLFDEQKHQTWRKHTCHAVHDADNTLTPCGQYDFLNSGDLLIRGGCFEVGRRFYEHQLGDLDFVDAMGKDIVKRLGGEARHAEPIDRWLDWRREHYCGLSLADAFYLEQRVGGWLSAIEQGLDMLPATSIHPANNHTAIAALVTPSERDRSNGRLQRDVIKQVAPELLRWPFNPPSVRDHVRASLQKTPFLWRYANRI